MPKILAAAIAPYSFAPAMVTSKAGSDRNTRDQPALCCANFADTQIVDLVDSAAMDGPMVRTRLEVNAAEATTGESWH
jgi:hypothetical protein